MTDFSDLHEYLSRRKSVVDKALEECFSDPEGPEKDLIDAMKYSLFAGGKRLRPVLCIAGAEAVGGTQAHVLPVACALEFIHTYSLIHDDLPVMDDDDLRRGKPTSHKVFGEAVALLAGDGLLTEAFFLMTDKDFVSRVPTDRLFGVTRLISRAAGYRGMIGGQVVDIKWQEKAPDIELVKFMHTHKTGALISASVVSGAILGGGSEAQVGAIEGYGEKIGLAFQISDDILDIEGDTRTMGKAIGADEKMGKATFPAVAGLAESKKIQSALIEEAVGLLTGFGPEADPLRWIASYIIARKK